MIIQAQTMYICTFEMLGSIVLKMQVVAHYQSITSYFFKEKKNNSEF